MDEREGRLAPAVDLYWIPLGAGGYVVRLSGKLSEALKALADLLQLRGAVPAQPHQRGRGQLPVPAGRLDGAPLAGGLLCRRGFPGRLTAPLAHGRPLPAGAGIFLPLPYRETI